MSMHSNVVSRQFNSNNNSQLINAESRFKYLFGEYLNFKRFRADVMLYLHSLSDNQRMSIEVYDSFLNSLNDETLDDNIKMCLMRLVVFSTTRYRGSALFTCSQKEFDDVLLETKEILESQGMEHFKEIYKQVLAGKKSANFSDLKVDLKITSFGNCHLKNTTKSDESKFVQTTETVPISERFAGKDPNVLFTLAPHELNFVIIQFKMIELYCKHLENLQLPDIIERARQIRLEVKNGELSKHLCELIALGRLAILKEFKIYPHNTQILALLGIMISLDRKDLKGRIAQVKTGEGKSIIIALLAFVLSYQGAVDIVSSSRPLAVRDQKKFERFFKIFGISTSHICEVNQEPKHFRGQILYGTVSDFEFAIMRDYVYGKGLFEERLKQPNVHKNFKSIIVDEADNLMIDSSHNTARIAIPIEISHSWVYPPILQFASQELNAVLLDQLRKKIDAPQTITDLRKHLESHGKGKYANCVKEIPDEQLKIWLESAYHANFIKKLKIDYIIKSKKEHDDKIVEKIEIIDVNNTGRALLSCRWNSGVHEFLEVKHGLEVEEESLTPISMSPATFYELYDFISGLTGTLGSEVERESIKNIYRIDSFDVPPYLPSLRIDHPPRIFHTEKGYYDKIIQVSQNCQKQRRSLLILSETILDTEKNDKILKENNVTLQILNETQDEDEDAIVQRAGMAGTVTDATNTATRGTDIILDEESIRNGGLHVLFTYYPDSERVEQQGIGRSGRQGQPGSSEIIILSPKAHQNEDLHKAELELLRLKRVGKVLNRALHQGFQVRIEQYCFKSYIQFFYKKLQYFHKSIQQESFLEKHIQRFQKIGKVCLISPLPLKDQRIAQMCKQIWESGTANILSWKLMLKEAGIRAKEKALNAWSIHFYQQVDKLVYRPISSDDELAVLEKKVDKLFEDNKNSWERYVNDPELGTLAYLNDIIGFS